MKVYRQKVMEPIQSSPNEILNNPPKPEGWPKMCLSALRGKVFYSGNCKKNIGKKFFIGKYFFYIFRLMSPQLLREMPVMHDAKGMEQ